MNINRQRLFDFSMGPQSATNFLIRKPNELGDSRNVVYNSEIGSMVGRPGITNWGDNFSATAAAPQGAHTANFREGKVRMVAVNRTVLGTTNTYVMYQDSVTGAWTDLITDLPADSQVFFLDYLNEVYVSGYDATTGVPFAPRNINAALNVSLTRNLLNCPYPYYFVEYLGLLYACNVYFDSTRYPDRVYKSSPPTGALTYVQGNQTSTTTIKTDSARYLKVGMAIDIYAKGTSSKLYDITITAVDKVLNTITFATNGTASVTSANVNTATDVLTSSAAHGFATGTPVTLSAGGTAPTGLTSGTVYYVINTGASTFKLATTAANASAGTAIDITAAGSGTNTFTYTYAVSDNDEIWLDGRYGLLSLAWNTDYPTKDRADFLAILPGTDSSNEITGAHKSSNRLFIFTENSSTRWDGQNLVTFNSTVGCISQRTLCNIDDDWLIWVDARGRIRARNESQGQQEFISRAIHNNIMSNFTEDDLRGMHAVVYDQKYKLYCGALDGENVRVVYDFDSNTWSPESLGIIPGLTVVDAHDGVSKPIIFGTDGRGYIDELGDDDDGTPIQFMAELGRTNLGTEGKKSFYGLFVYSADAHTLKIMAATGTGQFKTQGQIQEDEQLIKFPESGASKLPEASTVNYKIIGRYSGTPPVVEGVVPYFVNREDIPQNG